jgi:hypothetical protein
MNTIGQTQVIQPDINSQSGATQNAASIAGDGKVSPEKDAQPKASTDSNIGRQGLTAEGKALMQALKEIEQESLLTGQSGTEKPSENSTDSSFSMKKALTAAATIGGILIAVA